MPSTFIITFRNSGIDFISCLYNIPLLRICIIFGVSVVQVSLSNKSKQITQSCEYVKLVAELVSSFSSFSISGYTAYLSFFGIGSQEL